MKRLFILFAFFMWQILSLAQTIENPVFDRSDVSDFRVEKVEITPDTTFIFCIYHAEEQSWACISDHTVLEDIENGMTYPILKVIGIPFYPDRRRFSEECTIKVVLAFPHIKAPKINIIEDSANEAFNIYGIDLNKTYENVYTINDIETYFNLAKSKEEQGDWKGAIDFTLKQLEASKFVFGIQSKECSWAMYNLTMQYGGLGDYNKMIEWGKHSIDILTTLPTDSTNLDVLARAYGNVGSAYKAMKQLEEASKYMELSLSTRQMKDGVGVYNYERYLNNMAVKYYYEGNYPKALLYGKEVSDIYKKKFLENNLKYESLFIDSQINLCQYYQCMNKYEEASVIGRETISLLNNGVCGNDLWLKYAAYNNFAGVLAHNGHVDESISYLEKAIEETDNLHFDNNRLIINLKKLLASILIDCKKDTIKAISLYESVNKMIEDSMSIGKTYNSEYAENLVNLYKSYIGKDRIIGMDYLNKAIQFQKGWQGEESVAYANLLLEYVSNILVDSLLAKRTDSLYNCLYRSSEIIKRHLENVAFSMSKTEREDYWNRYNYVFTLLIPTISGVVKTDKWNSLAYNSSLFYKGLLLSSETDFKNTIQLSNDSVLIKMYSEYVQNLSLLEKNYSSGKYSLTAMDSLKSKIKENEYLLSQKVTKFNKETKKTITWDEIKKQLNNNDVAIEVMSYKSIDGSTNYYDAYVIKNKYDFPKIVSLFDEEKLKKRISSEDMDRGISSLFWGNDSLFELIKDSKRIFISPSGLLNTVGIEYLPLKNDSVISDKYEIYRLSSTRELCFMPTKLAIQNACLYGGLDYNNARSGAFTNRKDGKCLSQSVRSSIKSRGDFDYLIGSKQEIEQVEYELTKNNIRCIAYKGLDGTEESFKNISGTQTNLIHLSTHGMFLSDNFENIRENNNYRFIIPSNTSYIDDEDKSLSRSFLVLSGGNSLIHRDSISEENEDGILTALEISHLDFSNLDLVVLSACETALGDINSDGVYGLQRGFKKAGANTILMSLNKVDDEATRILMVEFYRNLMNGKTKLQSLKEAQQYLRKVDNGKYDAPKYWASFIMLDGLN